MDSLWASRISCTYPNHLARRIERAAGFACTNAIVYSFSFELESLGIGVVETIRSFHRGRPVWEWEVQLLCGDISCRAKKPRRRWVIPCIPVHAITQYAIPLKTCNSGNILQQQTLYSIFSPYYCPNSCRDAMVSSRYQNLGY